MVVMVQVAVTSLSFSLNERLVQKLKSYFPNARINSNGERLRGDRLVEFLEGCQAAIVGVERVDRDLITRLPDLRLIAKYGVGLDNIDQAALAAGNVLIGWTGGVNRRSVSELALSGMLGLARNIFFSGYSLKNGKWDKRGGFELTGKTVGIVGCGFTGEDLIRLLQPFHCEILINDIQDKRFVAKSYGATQVAMNELLERSDLISLHVPLTEETNRFFGAQQFAAMKRTAYLINSARGDVVDQDALKSALQTGEIAGASIDVFAEEPPEDLELLALDNLMVTPHIGGNSAEAVEAMGNAAIENLLLGLKKIGLVD